MIRAYLRQRLPLSFFGPLALLLAAGALGRLLTPLTFSLVTIEAFLLLAQFRIWDDVADRHRDAVTHPERILVTAKDHRPLLGLAVALVVINAAAAVQRDRTLVSILILAVLHAGMGGYYLVRAERSVLGDQVLLAKYPAFVLTLAGERLFSAPVTITLSAAAVYAAASAYEAWHDPVSPLAQLLGGRS